MVPECLFIPPYPPNLLTVPCCRPCNLAKSKDDAFLRDFLSVDLASHRHPVAAALFDRKVRRSVARNSSEFAKLVVSRRRMTPLYTPAGVYIGDFPGMEIPGDRIGIIVRRLVRGLYFNSRRHLFPADHPLKVLRHPADVFPNLYAALTIRSKPPATYVLGTVFGCAFVYAEEPFNTIWLLWFFEQVLFSAVSTNPESA